MEHVPGTFSTLERVQRKLTRIPNMLRGLEYKNKKNDKNESHLPRSEKSTMRSQLAIKTLKI